MKPSFFYLAVGAFLLSILSGCACAVGSKTTVPATDGTPPTVALDFQRPNSNLQTVVNATTFHVPTPETITFIARADDPDGVKEIGIWVEETWWVPGQQTGPGLLGAPEQSQSNNNAVGGAACTAMLTQLNLEISSRKRAASGYRARVWATSVNFSNVKTQSPVVEINWP